MKTAVRYYSRGGNTKKIAEAIAEAAGVPARTLDEPLEGPIDLLFLGGAIYGGKIHEQLANYLAALEPGIVKRVAVFSTACGPNSAYPQVREALAQRGISVAGSFFHCKSRFLFFNWKHPNQQDCQRAAEFARGVMRGNE